MVIKLAFRNIFRNFRRTFFTFLAIAVGLALLIVMDSLLSGIDKESFKKIIDYETGHVKIFYPAYWDDKDSFPLDKVITAPDPLVSGLRANPAVAGVTARIDFRIMLSDGIDEVPAVGIAVDPDKDDTVFRLRSAVAQGRYLSATEEGMLIGEKLARDFNAGVGDTLTVLTRTRYGTYQALDLKIRGILKSNDPQIDWYSIVIPLRLGQKALDLGNSVTEIDIRLKDADLAEAYRDRLARDVVGIEAFTWKDLAEDVIAISKAKYTNTFIFLLGIGLISLIGISNTILMAAFERTREIGMMEALGMKRGSVVDLFVLEGFLIGLIGSVVGCGIGALLVQYWTTTVGIDYSFLMQNIGSIGYRTTGHLVGEWDPVMFPIAFAFGVIVSVLSSIYPAWVASRMQPSEALRK
jgi:putative ABC transport system permease protein